ncbi:MULTISPECIES: MarR family winged helix-turn-helix transcriptional regulator [unclassified Thioalkalivibrio]|uniref:MarR family winged helix-turn-helix transcriptional regulator n=1 Tax=unclassified Thioalkalivibrio TaxID=2621013 RepID=UPI0003659EBB|nr:MULTISPECIES: MarR family winged helix-turn-helix transcriptional regulator [unclassified Thioalkalivibrio]
MNASTSSFIRTIAKVIHEFRKHDPQMPMQTAAIFLEVAARPGITMKDLGSRLGVAQSTCSRNVSALSRMSRNDNPGLDLVEAREDPSERRRKQVWLTPKGKLLALSLEDVG